MFNYSINKIEDELLVHGIIKRHKHSFVKLFDNYSPLLFGIICRMTDNKQQAEDILQITFTKVWNQITTFDSSLSTLPTWLVRIAKSTVLEEIKSCKKTERQTKGLNNNVSESANILKGHISEIDPMEWFDLIYYKGLCYEEVASKYNITTEQVKMIVRNAVNNLKEVKINEAK